MAKKRRVFIFIENNGASDVLESAIKGVSSLVNEFVANPDDADLIVVSPAKEALRMLKENDEAKILIVIFLQAQEDAEIIAARALRRAYPDRVIIGYVIEPGADPADVMLVPYLLGAYDKQTEEVSDDSHAG